MCRATGSAVRREWKAARRGSGNSRASTLRHTGRRGGTTDVARASKRVRTARSPADPVSRGTGRRDRCARASPASARRPCSSTRSQAPTSSTCCAQSATRRSGSCRSRRYSSCARPASSTSTSCPVRNAMRCASRSGSPTAPHRIDCSWASPRSTFWRGVASDRPLLCVVDDAQWLDHGSAHGFGFVARRLANERVAFAFAARDRPR